MKTAISLPDEVFEEAERLAAELGLTRSRLYAEAVSEYLARHRDDPVTEKLNEVYAGRGSELDPVVEQLQAVALGSDDEW